LLLNCSLQAAAHHFVFCCLLLQMIVDSEYQGEDYEQFDRWLGVAQ
jgi:hypothetical protein